MSEWMFIFFLIFLLVIPLVCGFATLKIAEGKGRDSGGEKAGWFLLGFFFTIVGIIASLIMPPKTTTEMGNPPPPPPTPA